MQGLTAYTNKINFTEVFYTTGELTQQEKQEKTNFQARARENNLLQKVLGSLLFRPRYQTPRPLKQKCKIPKYCAYR